VRARELGSADIEVIVEVEAKVVDLPVHAGELAKRIQVSLLLLPEWWGCELTRTPHTTLYHQLSDSQLQYLHSDNLPQRYLRKARRGR
jgi:hypothetical protein